ncbi:hypothetical protein VE23_24985 [Paenibacillus sp. D9]|nr:hypothetical protein VE23_24985 [Paenibacillus sp. D9]
MIADFIGFMFFSTIEGVCLVALIMSIYRFALKDCPWQIFFTAIIMSLQSYFLREELSLSFLAPMLYVLLIMLLLNLVLLVPIHWSLFVATVGYFGYALIQLLVMILSFGWISVDEISEHIYKGYILQLISSVIAFGLARFLYNRGLGFSFDFESKRLKSERIITHFLIPILVIAFGYFLYQKDLIIIFLLLAIAIGFLLRYSIMKERAESDQFNSK